MTPAALLELERRATAGPWEWDGAVLAGGESGRDMVIDIVPHPVYPGCDTTKCSDEDRALIVALRNRARALAKLWAAALAYRELLRRPGEDHGEANLRVGDLFTTETGFLGPGRDCRVHSLERRLEEFEDWKLAKRKALAAALADLEEA